MVSTKQPPSSSILRGSPLACSSLQVDGNCLCPGPDGPPPPSPADHRQSSHHIHHPLSTHLPSDARRKKGGAKKGKKKHRQAPVPGETPTIEEAEEEDAGDEDTCDTETEQMPEDLLQGGSSPEAVQVGGREGRREGAKGSTSWALSDTPLTPPPPPPLLCLSSSYRRTMPQTTGPRAPRPQPYP